jgi:hypothetical protein
VTLLIVFVGACVSSLIISAVFTWAAGKSPLWNIGFAIVLALAALGLLVLGVIFLIPRIVPP